MDPVKQIIDEHRVIERALDVLDKIADGLEEGVKVPQELILMNIGMLMECTDEYHLGKDEAVLLPYLEENGKEQYRNTLVSLLDEYSSSRQFINSILEVIENYGNGDVDAAVTIMKNSRQYVQILRSQIEKEEQDLYTILKQQLDKDELAELGEKVEDFEYAWEGAQLRNFQKIVRELERKVSLAIW